MKQQMRRFLAVAVAAAMVLAPTAALAQEADPVAELQTVADTILAQVQQAADGAGVPVEDILGMELPFEAPDEDGEDADFTATLEEIIDRLAGGSLTDGDATGWQGLPWANAGNIMHVFVDVQAGSYPAPRPPVAEAPLPDLLFYDVAEAELTPSTPIVPGINPLLLAPVDDPLELPALLAMHWGGRLTSVQGGDWMTGFHSAGTGLVGSNVDTAERPAEDEATFPFYVPFLDEGDMSVADESIDFVGYAMVVQGGECTVIDVLGTAVGYACASFGTLLGDGVSFFNGEGPVNFRDDLAPLWEPAPEEVRPVLDAIDDLIAQVPVDEVLEQVLELVGDVDVPETPAAPTGLRGLLRAR